MCLASIPHKKEIPRKAFLLISVSFCLDNARALELLSLRTHGVRHPLFLYWMKLIKWYLKVPTASK